MSVSRPPVVSTDPPPNEVALTETLRRTAVWRTAIVLVLILVAAVLPMFGPSLALDGTGEAAAPGLGVITLLRTTMFAALCVLVGEQAASAMARRIRGAPDIAPRSWAMLAACAGAVAALGLALIVANGNLLPKGMDDITLGSLHQTTDGRLALIEINAFIAAALCATSSRPAWARLPLAAVVVAEALRAHPDIGPEHMPLVGSGLTLVHLTCAAIWAGGLLQILRTMRVWRPWPVAAVNLLTRYARVAAVMFAGITASGICSTLRKVPLDSVFTTSYGRVLVAKLLLVAVIAILALGARIRMRRSTDPWQAVMPARIEVVLLGVAVAVSALLTAVPAPVWWDRPPWG